MEMIEGGNLLEAILSKRGLEEERAKEVFFQLCSAVSYCHDKNVGIYSLLLYLPYLFDFSPIDSLIFSFPNQVIHGDLKPENILIRRRDGAIKLIDFGFAHIITSNSEKPEVSLSLFLISTVLLPRFLFFLFHIF